MNRSLLGRLDKLEPTVERRTHVIWNMRASENGDYRTLTDAEQKSETKERGVLPGDEVLLVRWKLPC